MGYPSEKEILKVRKKLEKVEPTRVLPKNASQADQLKFELCRIFVRYLLEHEITQKELAEQIEVEPARLNEIVKYRIDLFTVDRLLAYIERLEPNIKVTVS